uniref:Pre-rRNA-processing protein TSR2 homolog n=1 Tax=Strigamia maritima TaxID=126957 RepID=T1IK88_STRMM
KSLTCKKHFPSDSGLANYRTSLIWFVNVLTVKMAASTSITSCTFLTAVERVIANWEGLKGAVEQGIGQPHALEKVKWLTEVLDEFFKANDNLYPDEVEDFIADILNNEFDIIVKDGSIVEISQTLCLLFKLYSTKQTAEFESKVSSFPISSFSVWKCDSHYQDLEDDISDNFCHTSQSITQTENNQMEIEEEDDGWRVVRNSRKR